MRKEIREWERKWESGNGDGRVGKEMRESKRKWES